MSENTNLVTVEQVKEDLSLIIIKEYIPFAFKKKMVEDIIEHCASVDENGVTHIDSALKQMAFEFSILNQYTNLDLPEGNIIDTYDILKENGIVKHILNKINNNELQFIRECINEQINYIITIDNSIENLVAKGITTISNKFPDEKSLVKLTKEVVKQINKIDQNKLKYITEAIGWNNGINKTK
jgi:hypothetical protein